MLIPGNVLHTIVLPVHSVESAVVFNPKLISLQYFDKLEDRLMTGIQTGKIPLPKPVLPGEPLFEEIDSRVKYVIDNAQDKSAVTRLFIKSKLLEIIALMYQGGYVSCTEVSLNGARYKREHKLKQLLTYVNENFQKPLTIDEVSKMLDVTPEYFCRFFKKSTGMNFVEYINETRLNSAAQQLLSSDRQVHEIAVANGYENPCYFYRLFKQRYGMTPANFRRSNLSTEMA